MITLNYLACAAACLLTFSCAVSLKANAESYLDECNSLNQSAEKSYINFIQDIDDFAAYSGWGSCGDNTVLSMTANESRVNYHVEDASELFVELYSDGGTFATIAEKGTLQIGLTKMDQFSNMYRCRYRRQQDKVYLFQGGQTYSLKCEMNGLSFIQDSGNFENDDPYYGINAEISEDGLTYRPVELRLDRVLWQNYENYGNYFREFYHASLPAGTNNVRLTLYGYNRLPGGWSDLPNFPMLSHVAITRSESPTSSEPQNENPSSSSAVSSTPESAVSNNADTHGDDDSAETKRLIRSKNTGTRHFSGEESLPVKKINENPVQIHTHYFPAQTDHSSDASSGNSQLVSSVPVSAQTSFQESEQKLQHFYQGKGEEADKTLQNYLMPGLILLQIASAVVFLKPR